MGTTVLSRLSECGEWSAQGSLTMNPSGERFHVATSVVEAVGQVVVAGVPACGQAPPRGGGGGGSKGGSQMQIHIQIGINLGRWRGIVD